VINFSVTLVEMEEICSACSHVHPSCSSNNSSTCVFPSHAGLWCIVYNCHNKSFYATKFVDGFQAFVCCMLSITIKRSWKQSEMFWLLIMFKNVQTYVYKRPAMFPRSLIFATAFMGFFSVVIALFKVKQPQIFSKYLYKKKIRRREKLPVLDFIHRISLTLKEIKCLAFDLSQCGWVKNGYIYVHI